MNRPYTLLDHTADMAIKVGGRDPEEVILHAGQGMVEEILDTSSIEEYSSRDLRVDGDSLEELIVNWLREIHYIIEGEGFLIKRAEISLGKKLEGRQGARERRSMGAEERRGGETSRRRNGGCARKQVSEEGDSEGYQIKGQIYGEGFDPKRHSFKREIKAVTYHNLSFRQTADGWEATVTFDI